MRVCHVWENFWPLQLGGLERYILSLSTYLHKKMNIDFSLITGRSKLLLVTKNIQKFEDAGFLKVYRLGPNPTDLVNGLLFTALHSTPELAEKIRFASLCSEAIDSSVAKAADIFHVHGIWGLSDLEYANLGLYLSQHFHKPLMVTLHGGFVGDPLFGGMALERPAIKNILSNADTITTYSKDVYYVLEKMGLAQKTRFIVNFVDTLQLRNPSPVRHGDIILYVGRLERPQTPGLLIEAFRQVHTKFPNAKFNIVGYGTLQAHLQELIHEYNLENSVFLLGKQTDVRRFLWNSGIFVATTFGYIASLEAWSAGLAVIGPDFGILREIINNGSNGLLVKQNDVDDLAAAMILLLEDQQLREKLAQNGSETVKDYDIRAVSLKIAGIYDSLMGHH